MRAGTAKKSRCLSRKKGGPTSRDWAQVIQGLRRKYGLERLLRIQGMPRSTFYYNVGAARPDKWGVERREIIRIYHENKGRYGYRRITAEMLNRGYVINHKTVRRLMKEAGTVCRVRIKKYRSYKGEVGKTAPNILARDFTASMPLQKLATDVTEFSMFGAKLYLSPVLDLYNGEILAYTIYDHPVLDMVLDVNPKVWTI